MYKQFIYRSLEFKFKRKLNSVGGLSQLSKNTNTLIVYYDHELTSTMIYPFYVYSKYLKNAGVSFEEINIDNVDLKESLSANTNIKRVFFQPTFEMRPEQAASYLEYLKLTFPNAKIGLMDWFAPLTIKFAQATHHLVDDYIRKQLFKNTVDFAKETVGDTNLSDFYAKRNGIDLPTEQHSIPVGLEEKFKLWPNFYLSPQMYDLFKAPQVKGFTGRHIDLHARMAVNGGGWYQAMRQEAADAVAKIGGQSNVLAHGRVKRSKFFQELAQSKVVFSPFGYGEVCWRDYEAFATGAVLLKPNMNHVRTFSDEFISGETYVSINWDLSDFESKFLLTVSNQQEAVRIVQNSFEKMNTLITGTLIPEYISSFLP